MFKPSKEKSDKYNGLLHHLFTTTVDNPNAYELIYVYNYVTRNYVLFRQSITTNYVLGYTPTYESFVLLQFSDLTENDSFVAAEVEYFRRSDIVSFRKNLFGRYVLRLKNGRQYRFFIPVYVSHLAGSYMLPVLQQEKVNNFLILLNHE